MTHFFVNFIAQTSTDKANKKTETKQQQHSNNMNSEKVTNRFRVRDERAICGQIGHVLPHSWRSRSFL